MPEVAIKVGLNSSQVRTGAAEVKSQLDGMKRHSEAAHKSIGEHGGIHFRSEQRVEKGVSKLGQELASARTGADALAIGLERVGRILHLGLGLGIVAHLAGYFIEQNNKIVEQFEKLTEEAEAFGEAAHTAMDSGSFEQELEQLKKGVKLYDDLNKARAAQTSIKGFLGAVFSGDIFTGAVMERFAANSKAKGEVAALQTAVADAAVEELRYTAEIARLKADGHEKEAAALERERKFKQQIAIIERSPLDAPHKEAGKEALADAKESADAADELAESRQAAAELAHEINKADAEANTLIEERAHMGETEEAQMARRLGIVTEMQTYVQNAEDRAAHGMARESDALRIAESKLRVQKEMTKIAELASHLNEKAAADADALEKRLGSKRAANAEKLFRNSLDALPDEEKISALLKKRIALAKEYQAAMRAGNAEAAEDVKGKVIDLNHELQQIATRDAKQKPSAVASDLARKGLGGAVYFARDEDPAKRAAKALDDALKIQRRSEALLKRIAEKVPAWQL